MLACIEDDLVIMKNVCNEDELFNMKSCFLLNCFLSDLFFHGQVEIKCAKSSVLR